LSAANRIVYSLVQCIEDCFYMFVLVNCTLVKMASSLVAQVLGTPTREEIKCMNPNYTEFKFPQIKAHPWHKVCSLPHGNVLLMKCATLYIEHLNGGVFAFCLNCGPDLT
jgi:hypothetical protein